MSLLPTSLTWIINRKWWSTYRLLKLIRCLLTLRRNPLYGKLFTTIDGLIWFMLHMTPELDWRKDIPVPEQQNAGLDSLRILMKDFSVKADYAAFFNSNSDLYQISLATLAYNLPDFDEKNPADGLLRAKEKAKDPVQCDPELPGLGELRAENIQKRWRGALCCDCTWTRHAIRVPTFDVRSL